MIGRSEEAEEFRILDKDPKSPGMPYCLQLLSLSSSERRDEAGCFIGMGGEESPLLSSDSRFNQF